MEKFSRERIEKLADILLNMCLHFCGAQYTESILRSRGFTDQELAAVGFDVDGEDNSIDLGEEV